MTKRMDGAESLEQLLARARVAGEVADEATARPIDGSIGAPNRARAYEVAAGMLCAVARAAQEPEPLLRARSALAHLHAVASEHGARRAVALVAWTLGDLDAAERDRAGARRRYAEALALLEGDDGREGRAMRLDVEESIADLGRSRPARPRSPKRTATRAHAPVVTPSDSQIRARAPHDDE